MNKSIITGIIVLALAACHTPAGKGSPVSPAVTGAQAADSVKTYDVAILDNKKDPVCGMPSGAGMEDTLHIGGKVIGFCSKECRDAYLKSPKSYPVVYK
jgi:YHS domain-containing protein